MRPGQLRHRVSLQQRSSALDPAGGVTDAWVEFASRRASVERATGREVWASAQRSARVPTVFRLRYLAGVTPGMRLVFDGKPYNILSAIDQEGLRAELVVTAEEWVEEGA